MKNLEELKQTQHLMILGTREDGGYGKIFFPGDKKPFCSVVWSTGGGWEPTPS